MDQIPYSNSQMLHERLTYLMVYTKLDLARCYRPVNRFMGNPGKRQLEATKWVMRYLDGTINKDLL